MYKEKLIPSNAKKVEKKSVTENNILIKNKENKNNNKNSFKILFCKLQMLFFVIIKIIKEKNKINALQLSE